MSTRRQYFPYRREDIHMNSEFVTACTRPIQAKARQKSCREQERGIEKVPIIGNLILAFDKC